MDLEKVVDVLEEICAELKEMNSTLNDISKKCDDLSELKRAELDREEQFCRTLIK